MLWMTSTEHTEARAVPYGSTCPRRNAEAPDGRLTVACRRHDTGSSRRSNHQASMVVKMEPVAEMAIDGEGELGVADAIALPQKGDEQLEQVRVGSS